MLFSPLGFINIIIQVFIYAILASVIISWLRAFGMRLSPYNPIVHVIESIADLILRPIRRNLPVAAGGIDFSPMVAIIILIVAQRLLVSLLLR